jgi:ABC-type transport system involved in multi-copper enzyme maturation permease subunit
MKMIGQLLWKEGREHLWKMAALLGLVLVPIVAVLCWIRLGPVGQRSGDGSDAVMICGCWLVPTWLGAWTATGEKTRGTMGMLTSLPMRRWKIFGVKTAWGLATVLLPLAAGMGLVHLLGWARGREEIELMWLGLAVATSLYLMIVALTAGIRKEGMAAMVGLLVVLGSAFWAALAGTVERQGFSILLMIPNPFFAQFAADQVGLELLRGSAQWRTMVFLCLFALQGAFAGMWWVVGAWRFGKQSQREGITRGPGLARNNAANRSLKQRHQEERAAQSPLATNANLAPRRFLFGANLWREWREQAWIVASAGLAAVGIALVGALVAAGNSRGADPALAFVDLTGMLALVAPTAVALMLGTESMARDLEPGMMGFWRSRPIRTAAFFWSKYFVALAGVWLLLLVLAGMAFLGMHLQPLANDELRGELGQMTLTALAGWLPLVLTVTMLLYALLRRAIYAVISAVMVLAAILYGTAAWLDTHRLILDDVQWVLALTGIAAAAGLAILTHAALERNWGLHGTKGSAG